MGRVLYESRVAKGWTQQRCADEIGCSCGAYRKWESRGSPVGLRFRLKTEAALGISLSNLSPGCKGARSHARMGTEQKPPDSAGQVLRHELAEVRESLARVDQLRARESALLAALAALGEGEG